MNWTQEDLLHGVDEPEQVDLEVVAVKFEDDHVPHVQLDLLDEVILPFEHDKVIFEPPELDEELTTLGGA